MKKSVFLSIAVCWMLTVYAQRDTSHTWMVRANVQHGTMLPEYGFMSLLSDSYANGFEVSVMHISSGKSMWDHLYRFPGFGVSFYFTTMGSKQYFGNQYSLYPYYSLNILRKKQFELNYQMGLGVSYATRKYNPESNYENLAIGSHFNIHYHADLIGLFRVSSRFNVNAGISFSHISNANLSEPNVGINTCALYAGVGYSFGQQPKSSVVSIDPLVPYFTYEVMLAGGMKHTRTFESFQYPAFSVSFDAKRRFGYKFALGIGVDFFYDSSVEPQMERLHMNFSPSNAYSSGIHLAEEFVYDKFSLIVQEGIYIGLTDKLNHYIMYNRVITRYKFSKHWFANFSLKSHLYILDFPELGIGYYW